jgi:drug/metabolite transporter (DMT)-like permease
MRQPTVSDWLLLAGLVVAWGSSFSMTKVAVSQFDPAWVMALRLAIAGVFLFVILVLRGQQLPAQKHLWAWFFLLGIIGHALPFFLISWGTQFVTSGTSGVLMGAIPLLVIVLAHFFLPDEKLNVMKAVGFVTGFAGLLIVIGGGAAGFAQEWSAVKGELAILLGCLCYAVHGIFARRIPFSDPVRQSAAVCLCAAAAGLVFAGFSDPSGFLRDDPSSYLAIVGLGLVPTGIATLLMYRIVAACGVSFVAYSNYLVPVFALAFGALTLGEDLAFNVVAGLILILVGIAVSQLRRNRRKVAA